VAGNARYAALNLVDGKNTLTESAQKELWNVADAWGRVSRLEEGHHYEMMEDAQGLYGLRYKGDVDQRLISPMP